MAGIDVVVPVHGQWNLTQRCLSSLDSLRVEGIERIIVADDASPDDTKARLRECSGISAVSLDANGGFSRACNAGAAAGSAPFVLFLNNDAFPKPGTVATLVRAFSDVGVGAAGPLILNGDGTVQSFGLVKSRGSVADFERLYAYHDAALSQAARPYDAAVLSGAALAVRRDAFEQLGGFDERFVNGLEDVDLCLRLLGAGYRLCCTPRAVVEHLEGASRGKAHAGAANGAVFDGIWNGALPPLPVLEEPAIPIIDIRWRSADARDRGAASLWRMTLRTHAGGTAVWNAAPIAAARASLEKRARLLVYGGAPPKHAVNGSVRMCAPESAAEAAAERELRAAHYWAASDSAATLLRGAECTAANVHVVRLGLPPEHTLEDVRSIAGRWASGLTEVLPQEVIGDTEEELRRRLPDVYAGRRVRELARAAVYGVPPIERFTMSAGD